MFFSLVNALRNDTQGEGDPALITNKEFCEADVVGDEGGDDTESSSCLGNACARQEVACGTVDVSRYAEKASYRY